MNKHTHTHIILQLTRTMQVFLTVSFQRLAFYSPDQVVALLQAFVRLGHRPQGLWLDEMASKVCVYVCVCVCLCELGVCVCQVYASFCSADACGCGC